MGITTYDKMSDEELGGMLKLLRSAKGHPRRIPDQVQELLEDLQIHQIELEMQNRELQEARRQLETSRNRLAALYDAAPVGYLSLDRRGCIREINRAGADLLGAGRAQLIGFPLPHFLAGDDVQRFLGHLQDAGVDRQVRAEFTLIPRTDARIRVELRSVAAEEGDGTYTVVVDITDRWRAEEALLGI